jgi:hypothetical protein
MMSRNLLLNIYRGLVAGACITTARIIIAFATLTVAAPAFAQSTLDRASAPATDYALPPPEDGSLIEPVAPDDATSGDTIASAAIPAAAVAPVTAAENASAGTAVHSGWDRIGDVYTDTNSDDQADQVLEVPQVLPPGNPQPSDDADQTAPEDTSQSPDQVGSIDDYQDEEDGALMGTYGFPVSIGPAGIGSFGVSAFQTPFNRGFGLGFQPGFVPTVPWTFAGGMNSAILPASPMFPRGSMRFSGMRLSGGMRGGRR